MKAIIRFAGASVISLALAGVSSVFAQSHPLYGHSGGGAVASFYQAVAENGVAFCQDAKKLSLCSDALKGLPAADGVVFPDAHPGLGVMDVRGINPSISVDSSDSAKLRIDASLDPYDVKNGFDPKGPSHYSEDFQKRYFAIAIAVVPKTTTRNEI